MTVQSLESRNLLASWIAELPSEVQFAAVAQGTNGSDVCLAYVGGQQAGTAKVNSQTTDPSSVALTDFPASMLLEAPFVVTDAAVTELGDLHVVGSALPSAETPVGPIAPARWIDQQAALLPIASDGADSAGVIHAVDSSGRAVGEDDFLPIVIDGEQVSALSLPAEANGGAALDINGERIAGVAGNLPMAWTLVAGDWVAMPLTLSAGDLSGKAMTVSKYGIVGGAVARGEGGADKVGVLWGRDGTILKEFDLPEAAEVTHVVDFYAAVSTPSGTQLFDARTGQLADLDDYLRLVGQLGVDETALDLIDMELSEDGKQVLLLVRSVGEPTGTQYAVSLDIEALPADWQHPWNRYDVSGDGNVSPVDALQIINRLAQVTDPRLPPTGTRMAPYYDVSGDTRISPIDALQVINQIAREINS
ncbi:dockerin type I domain-containing protein [Roseiconus nitratireducens]|nr:dockerin type I domain-containing protein [Roseiconus nitratireducens]